MLDKSTQRSCFSTGDKMLDKKIMAADHMITNNSQKSAFDQSDNTDYNKKVQTFKAMISPQYFRTSSCVTSLNDELKFTSKLSEGTEDAGSHLKFKVTASGANKTVNALRRPLNEFQLTYEQDKERTRDKNGQKTYQEMNSNTFLEDNISSAVINHVNATRNDQQNRICFTSSNSQLNEFQLTYEQDKIRSSSFNDFNKSCSLDEYERDTFDYFRTQRPRIKDLSNLCSVKTSSYKKDMKQMIKYPTEHIDKMDSQHFGTIHSQRNCQSDDQSNSLWYNQETLPSKSSAYIGNCNGGVLYLVSHINVNCSPSPEGARSDLENLQGKTTLVSRSKSRQAETHTSKISKPKNAYTVPNNKQQQGKRCLSQLQSAASVRSHSEPSLSKFVSHPRRDVHESQATLIKNHANVHSANLLSFSTQLKCVAKSASDSLAARTVEVKLPTAESIKHDDLLDPSDSEIKYLRNTQPVRQADFTSNIHISLSISNPSLLECENDGKSLKSSTSKSSTLESPQQALLGSPTVIKQTNVKLFGSPQAANAAETHLISLKSRNKNNSFVMNSSKQTNISTETELALTNDLKNLRTNGDQSTRVADISDHNDTHNYHTADTKFKVFSELDNDRSDNCDAIGGTRQKIEVIAKNGCMAITDHDYDSTSDNLDSNEIHCRLQNCNTQCSEVQCDNNGQSVTRKCLQLKLEKLFKSKSCTKSLPEKCDSKMSSCYQANPVTSVYSRTSELKPSEKTKVSTKERISYEQRTCKEPLSTLPKGQNVSKRNILAKRPQRQIQKEATQSCVGEDGNRLITERSKSAMEFSLTKYNSKSCGSTFQERKQPESSMAFIYPYSKIQTSLRNQQKQYCIKGTHNLKENIFGVPLEKKVHKLHQEVEERLRSRENISYGYGSYKSNSSKTENKRDELNDVSAIFEDVMNSQLRKETTEKSSTFVTSTPVKHAKNDRCINEKNESSLHFNTKQSSAVKASISGDLVSTNCQGRCLNECQTLSARQNSNESVPEKDTSARNKLTSDVTSIQTVMAGVSKCHNGVGPLPLTSLMTVKSHLKSGTNKNEISNIKQQMLLMNKVTEPSEPGHPLSIRQMSKFASSGRNSPADSLLDYLDNPSIVYLLQKLYRADYETRQIIMTQAEFFKAWQHYVVSSRDHRARKVMLTQKSVKSCVYRLLHSHFSMWQLQASHSRNMRQANALYCSNMLTKGFRALRWSVNQSKYLLITLQTRIHAIRLKASFQKVYSPEHLIQTCLCFALNGLNALTCLNWPGEPYSSVATVNIILGVMGHTDFSTTSQWKHVRKAYLLLWKVKVEKQRRECLANSVKKWKQYVCETKKTHHMRHVMECRIMMDVLHQWKTFYNKRVKMNIAFSYMRKTLVRQALTLWQVHFSQCKQKKEMYTTAVLHHQQMLLKSSLQFMTDSLCKAQKAGAHLRHHRVSTAFLAWKSAIKICLVERKEEMAVSMEHWQKQTLRQCFTTWKEKLVINITAKKADFNTCRKIFLVWRQAWEAKIVHYQAVEAAVIRNKLHNVLLAWRENVVQIQRKQKLAVALIEDCYLKQVFQTWRMYTSAKVILKRKTKLHQVIIQHKILVYCFTRWQEVYKQQQEAKLTRQMWSEGCARKVACQWKLLCYRRLLTRLFEVTQPAREHRLMRVMLVHWVSSLNRRRKEMEQADDFYKTVQWHHMLFVFTFWRKETQRTLTIKPLVQRQEKHTMKECFVGWKGIVLQKSKCIQYNRRCLMKMLCKCFCSWRQHYQACLVEKQIKKQMTQGLLLMCLKEWWFLIHRKKKGQNFNIVRLMHQTFYCWKNRATDLCTCRAMMKKEEETNLNLKKKYLTTWLEHIQTQVSWTEQCVGQFIQKHDKAVIFNAFIFWRHYMQSTLISCAYQKGQNQRLLFTIFSAWRELTHISVSEAILKFSERIGLPSEVLSPGRSSIRTGYIDKLNQENATNLIFDKFKSSCPSLPSFMSLAGETDKIRETRDRMLLLTGGLQDFANDHKTKCHRIKETAHAVIHRLMHWPVCAVFEQWKEFTARERTLKTAMNQLQALHLTTVTSTTFKDWKIKFLAAKTAQDYRNAHLLSSSLKGLCWYRDHRKYAKRQSQLACHHNKLVVLRKFFPSWLNKTQMQLKDKHILHLWTECTEREIELNPIENCLTHKLGHRSLLACFTLWLVKYQAVIKIRNVYQSFLLRWVFYSWQEWARERHDDKVKSLNMCYRRRTQMTFQFWTHKLHQIKETDRRYKKALHNYLLLIMQRWHWWAKFNNKLNLLERRFELQQSQHSLVLYFCQWKTSAIKLTEFRINRAQRITYSMFCGWSSAVKSIRNDRQKTEQCQVLSNMFLVKRLFHRWYSDYTKLKVLQNKKRQYVEQCAVSAVIVWKKKAQKTRGQHLESVFLRRKMICYLQKWNASLFNLRCLYSKLDLWNQKRNISMLSQYLKCWKTQIIAYQARKIHTCRFLCTVMAEWHYLAMVRKERHIKGLALKKAVQSRSLVVHFKYWLTVTRVKISVQQNVETRLQIRALRSWKLYTHRMCNLRKLQELFVCHITTRRLCCAFKSIQLRAEHCASLQKIAENFIKDKKRELIKVLFKKWNHKLNNIVADQCYEHILAARVTRQWQRLINIRKLTQLKEKQNWKIAADHHHHRVCKSVFAALKLEVMVSELAAKRRQNLCFKYARRWKLNVDLQKAATTLEYECIQRHAWNKWRLELIKFRSANQVMELLQTQLLYQVFSAWRGLCKSRCSNIIPQSHLHSSRKTSTELSSLMSEKSSLISKSTLSSINSRSSPTKSAAIFSFGFKSMPRV